MKFYLLIPFLAANYLFAQNSQLYYSGKFLNQKNKPQNFLKIHNKNSGIYELTDEEGFAVIEAKPFDTLVWNNGKNSAVISTYDLKELKIILENKVEKQRVEEIYSKSYDSIISKENPDLFSIENSKTFLSKNSDSYFWDGIRKLKQKKENAYKIKQQEKHTLLFNGVFTTGFDIKSRNGIPQTQNQYVQGRSENGSLVWKGPETNEIFSFGPDISTLGFDNLPYEYDQNGKLVDISSAVSPAKIYNNDIFKTTVGYNNYLKISSFVKQDYREVLRFSFDIGQQKDQMYFSDQFNNINSLKARLNGNLKGYIFNLAFNYEENKSTNSNRIGIFNRAFQNSLLTPASFSNSQNLFLSDGSQRSYSQFADNPLFLFDQKNKYNYQENRRQFSWGLEKNFGDFKLSSTQSYEDDSFGNFDQYKPSIYGFINGLTNERIQNNILFNSNIAGSYTLGKYYSTQNIFSLNFILNDRKSNVYHSSTQRKYYYQRTSQDYLFNYNLKIERGDFRIDVNLGNSFYVSNTSHENNYWLPKANVYLNFRDIFNWNYNFKLFGAYTQLSSEPEITRSYASYATTLLNAENSYQYFPVNEVETFKGLSNIDVREWKTGFKLNFGYRISLDGEYFKKKIFNDIFPVYENNQLQLKNLADHTYSGYELNLSFNNIPFSPDFYITQKVSFFKYKDIVDRIDNGYNNLALSGFSDIYKTLTQDQVLGAVMGSYFERNEQGQLIIDEFGYPKKANGLKIIADPTPDFVMKFNHTFSFKRFTLDINWEWKKGGQLWNGTQAVLDYYGRSQNSADQRNVKNYVFEGVNSTGNVNQIPVDFYDLNQPVSNNRWARYGYLGVAEDYIQKADYVRVNSVSLSADLPINHSFRTLTLTFYVNNILLWQANKGVDPNQNFYNTENGKGLDYFNLPSFKTFGCMVSFKF